MAWETQLDSNGQNIFIAPPHGVLPYGNLLTVHAMKNINGLDFRGLTTDAALKLPFFRHCTALSVFLYPRLVGLRLSRCCSHVYLCLYTDLGAIGTIPASSHVAKKHLDQGWSIGISSGGVAEIFETNSPDEVCPFVCVARAECLRIVDFGGRHM